MIEYLLVFLTGLLNKLADLVADDGLKLKKCIFYPIGPIYGFLIAYIITTYPVFAPLGMAIMLSCIIAGKIDSKVHYVGIGTFFFFIYLFGLPAINLPIFAAFFCAGLIDEIGNYYADKGKFRGMIHSFFHYRRTTDVAAVLVSALTGLWIYLLAVICYDVGYVYIFQVKDRVFPGKSRK